MTETEWLESDEPGRMLEALGERASLRKLRLFACACCRLLPEHVIRTRPGGLDLYPYADMDKDTLRVFDVAEKYADTHFPISRQTVHISPQNAALRRLCDFDPAYPLAWVIDVVNMTSAQCKHLEEPGLLVSRLQALLLQEIFGNPLRRVSFDPAWRAPSAITIAQTIYAERRFEYLPALADALEKAGCTNADLLSHCRQGGEHVRGCWVVDLILGKE